MELASTAIQTSYGVFTLTHHSQGNSEGVSLVMGNPSEGPVLLRIHSSCLFSEALCAIDCDCKLQLDGALERIGAEGSGILLYLYQEGRGVGLANKVRAVATMQQEQCDTATAFEKLGYDLDPRDYSLAVQMLDTLGASKTIRLASNNPRKFAALTKAGYTVIEQIPLSYEANSTVRDYLKSKEAKLGHKIAWQAIRPSDTLKTLDSGVYA